MGVARLSLIRYLPRVTRFTGTAARTTCLALSLGLSGLAAGTSCATLNYEATHRESQTSMQGDTYPGDIYFDERLEEVALYTSVPSDGEFIYDEEAGTLMATPESGHQVLERVQLQFPTMENPLKLIGFIKYRPEQRWRKGLCYWQVPLFWITLGAWAIVPLNYPCHSAIWHTGSLREVAGEDTRKLILEDALKAEALRLQGNAVVLAFIADQGATGWIVRLKDRPVPAPVEPGRRKKR